MYIAISLTTIKGSTGDNTATYISKHCIHVQISITFLACLPCLSFRSSPSASFGQSKIPGATLPS